MFFVTLPASPLTRGSPQNVRPLRVDDPPPRVMSLPKGNLPHPQSLGRVLSESWLVFVNDFPVKSTFDSSVFNFELSL